MDAVLSARRCSNVLPISLALAAVVCVSAAQRAQAQTQPSAGTAESSNDLPDAPSASFFSKNPGMTAGVTRPVLPLPCPPTVRSTAPPAHVDPNAVVVNGQSPACVSQSPLSIVINAEERQPLTSAQKGYLAARDVVDPFNLVVIGGEAAGAVATNAHSAYGPGFKGFGRLSGYYLLQDAQGEFFGTFLIPSIVHEDPRYRRMQHASVPRRILHALAHTVVAQHDDGRYMPNYATLLTYPISAELSNLYVPGVQGNASSTMRRIGIGLATDPASNLVAEFLPDLARRVHVRSVFIQQIVNQMATGIPMGQQ